MTKDGTLQIKEYATVKGQDWRAYKREKDATYRRKHRETNAHRTSKPTKVERVPPEIVAEMKKLHSIGLNFVLLGKHFNVSRYVAQMCVLGWRGGDLL